MKRDNIALAVQKTVEKWIEKGDEKK